MRSIDSAPAPVAPAAMPGTVAAESWTRRLVGQWKHRQLAKVVGICAFTAAFFAGYFHLLRNPSATPVALPLLPPDHWIAYEPRAVWPYLSLWIYVGIPPAVLPSLAAGARYAVWAGALCVTGLLCFWLWPTELPPGWLPADAGGSAGLVLLRGLDAPGNACPSMHVASAVFSALWIRQQLDGFGAPAWPRRVNLLWLAAIIWSTMALRQHVLVDVLAGAALGAIFGAAALRWGPPTVARDGVDRRL
jgi:membrane-associated phospholipid phosphatase